MRSDVLQLALMRLEGNNLLHSDVQRATAHWGGGVGGHGAGVVQAVLKSFNGRQADMCGCIQSLLAS